jgi:RimJ/RimL family protein N-acetyltransferase
MLNEGLGVKEDKKKAREFFNIIENRGFKPQFTNLTIYCDEKVDFDYNKKYNFVPQNESHYLREFVLDDYKRLLDIYKNENFKEAYPHDTKTLEDAYKLAKAILDAANKTNMNSFSICEKIANEMIGVINFRFHDDLLVIGYILDYNLWNKKIATNAAFEALNTFFEKTEYDHKYATVTIDNISSIKVLLKLNFKYQSKIIDYLSIDSKTESYHFKLKKEDFFKLKNNFQ